MRTTILWQRTLARRAAGLFALCALVAAAAAAQDRGAAAGGIKGRVRVAEGSSPAEISVTVRQGEREVAQARTNRRGEFEVQGLAPGEYGLTFRKPGLSVGRLENVEVRAGKVRSLSDKHLYLPVDEGSIAFLRGTVFDQRGLSLPRARVELARLLPDGSLRKLGDRVTTETGSFAFRLPPDAARYRVTAKADGMRTAAEEVVVDGAAIFRVALTLNPAAK